MDEQTAEVSRVTTTLVLGSTTRGGTVAAGQAGGGAPRDESGAARPDADAADPRPTWQQVVDEHGDRIYTIAYRLTGNPDDAADLTQDVFVRVFRNLHRYEPGTFAGWLYRITKNLFLDRVRRQQRIRMESLPDEESRAPVSHEPGPADIVERATLEARLEEGLARLPVEFRLAVVYCDVVGLSYEEIAEATGWPIGTVRSRIHRGRRQLRTHLERMGTRAAHEPSWGPADG
jgi:RNA polymerase sigma-70 factor, ECF subfamily